MPAQRRSVFSSWLALLGLASMASALWLSSRRTTLPERLLRCADDLQIRVYS